MIELLVRIITFPIFILWLKPIIIDDFKRRYRLALESPIMATPDNLHPWDVIHWADELACKWGHVVDNQEGEDEVHNEYLERAGVNCNGR